MDAKQIMQIFADTAYVRTGGSPEELRTAEYLRDKAAELGLSARLVPVCKVPSWKFEKVEGRA